MNKKVYAVLTKIPIIGVATNLICQPYMFSSVGYDDGVYDDLLKYMKKHPDVLMTKKLAQKIYKGQVK